MPSLCRLSSKEKSSQTGFGYLSRTARSIISSLFDRKQHWQEDSQSRVEGLESTNVSLLADEDAVRENHLSQDTTKRLGVVPEWR